MYISVGVNVCVNVCTCMQCNEETTCQDQFRTGSQETTETRWMKEAEVGGVNLRGGLGRVSKYSCSVTRQKKEKTKIEFGKTGDIPSVQGHGQPLALIKSLAFDRTAWKWRRRKLSTSTVSPPCIPLPTPSTISCLCRPAGVASKRLASLRGLDARKPLKLTLAHLHVLPTKADLARRAFDK